MRRPRAGAPGLYRPRGWTAGLTASRRRSSRVSSCSSWALRWARRWRRRGWRQSRRGRSTTTDAASTLADPGSAASCACRRRRRGAFSGTLLWNRIDCSTGTLDLATGAAAAGLRREPAACGRPPDGGALAFTGDARPGADGLRCWCARRARHDGPGARRHDGGRRRRHGGDVRRLAGAGAASGRHPAHAARLRPGATLSGRPLRITPTSAGRRRPRPRRGALRSARSGCWPRPATMSRSSVPRRPPAARSRCGATDGPTDGSRWAGPASRTTSASRRDGADGAGPAGRAAGLGALPHAARRIADRDRPRGPARRARSRPTGATWRSSWRAAS